MLKTLKSQWGGSSLQVDCSKIQEKLIFWFKSEGKKPGYPSRKAVGQEW
jgi:hypothetical protein